MGFKSLPAVFFTRANERKNNVVFEYRIRRDEPYRTVSWNRLQNIVYEIAYGLIDLGLQKGKIVAIISETRYEWAACDYAILSCGGIVVPIYPTLPPEAVNYILNDSEVSIVVVEGKGQLQKIRGQWEKLPHVKYAIVIDDFGDLPENDSRILSLQNLRDKGRVYYKKDPAFILRYIDDVDRYDIATIIYTSGTTGNPKGVVLTHNNILSVIEILPSILPVGSKHKFLSFLPLSHVFERVVGLHFPISIGTTISYCSSMDQVGKSLVDSEASVMMVVPRMLEKIHTKLENEFSKAQGLKKKLLDWAFNVSKKWLHLKNQNKGFSIKYCYCLIQRMLADKIVFSKVRKKLAPQMKYFVSGGAPLSIEIAEYFHILGYTILQGYGLTETTAPATTNTVKENKLGTVGKPLPISEIKIAEDGEILIKGDNVFSEYYKNKEKTKEAFVDGWFKSGDIGEFDNEGFLKITDRKKDLIITSSGKNVAPQNIENAIKTSQYISNVIVIGDKRKYLSALVTLDHAAISDYAKSKGISNDINMLCENPEIISLINEEIKYKTAPFADYEQIRRFTILPEDFTISNGEITPTMKIKRNVIEHRYKSMIDKMYPSTANIT